MLTNEEKKDLIFVRETDSVTLTKNHLKIVFNLHQKIFKQTCTACASKIAGYIERLKTVTLETMEQKAKAEYAMKEGKMLRAFGTSGMITNGNLTDELAVRILSVNENRITKFSKFPDNWKEQVEAYKGEAVAEPIQEAVEPITEEVVEAVAEPIQEAVEPIAEEVIEAVAEPKAKAAPKKKPKK